MSKSNQNVNQQTRPQSRRQAVRTLAFAASAVALGTGLARAGTTPQAVTVSLSGSTAMRNFTVNAQFTALTPGNTVSLNNGYTYHAANVDAGNGVFPAVQLGATFNDSFPPADPLVNANYRAFRVEWHEQGSVEGILEMANDQIAPVASVAASNRNPTSGNPIWVNGNLGGTLTAPGTNAGGFAINTSTYNTYTDFTPAGVNTQGGQNRVQMAISDVTARQGFSTAGTSAYNRTPGQAGYGKGNTALGVASNGIVGLGTANARRQLNDASVLNMSTDKVDPSTGANYAAGAWNTAGVDNVVNKTVAITASTFAANPGTGLTRVNRTDAQFLQATGRLANGADFNVVTRDVNSGTLNVASLNVGLDPSFAVGENDAGDGNSATGGTTQTTIGGSITFSGKTAGGGELRPTVQNSRMAVGHLSISDIRSGSAAGTASNGNAGSRPLRALAYRDDANDVADGSNAAISAGFADAASGAFVKPSFATITDGSYAIYQNETYVTVRTPGAAYGTDAIKGDYATQDVKQLRDNILGSAGTYPSNASFLNPANGLIAQGFIPSQYMAVRKDQDGLNQSVANPGFDAANYPAIAAQAQANFVVADASAVTTGTASTYGAVAAGSGGIAITNGNFLFGDFNNDGDRDFADVKLAIDAQAKLFASGNGVAYVTGSGATNAQPVGGLTGALATMTGYDGTTGAKKGDLIVKGDFNSDGAFDGKDLYLLAHGAALADSTAVDTLGAASGATFGDQVRNGVLRKNAALDFLNATATAQQKTDAGGANAFNKFDVNHDGAVDRKDASVVDKFVGGNVTDLGQQIDATIGVDGTASTGVAQKSISLIDAELQDNLTITATDTGSGSDFSLLRAALGSGLLDGDTNFDGVVNFGDLLIVAQNYNLNVDRWSKGDFTLDGIVEFGDLLGLAQNYTAGGLNDSALIAGLGGNFAADFALAQSLVPEPTTLAAAGLAGLALGRRRRAVK